MRGAIERQIAAIISSNGGTDAARRERHGSRLLLADLRRALRALVATGAGARHVHAGARHHHRECFDAHHRRQSGRLQRSRHLGHHFVRRRQRHLRAADRLADAALRRRANCSSPRCCASRSHRSCAASRGAWRRWCSSACCRALVSGPMVPGSQALLLIDLSAARKGTALAIWSMTTLVAPICGPILGGYISDNYSWPWIFYINVPVGLFCAFVCWQASSIAKRRRASCRSTTSAWPAGDLGRRAADHAGYRQGSRTGSLRR